MLEDSNPSFMGIWNKRRQLIRSPKDFSLFFIWLKKEEDYDGFYIDNLGKAMISNFYIERTAVKFLKEYEREANIETFNRTRMYQGSGKSFISYQGTWKLGGEGGEFLMTRFAIGNLEELEKYLFEIEKLALSQRILEKRKEFPHLSLEEIHY